MITYWLMGEKEELTSPSAKVKVQDDSNLAQNALEFEVPTPTINTEASCSNQIAQATSTVTEATKRAHFLENVTDSRLPDSSSNSSSKIQSSTHIFSNPMTSIVIVDDEDTDQLHSSSKLPPKEISSLG